MRAGFGVGVDVDRAGPDLLRADAGEIDRRGAVHARRLRRVGVELVARDHLDAVLLPVDRGIVLALAHLSVPISCWSNLLARGGEHGCSRGWGRGNGKLAPGSPECERKNRAGNAICRRIQRTGGWK